MCCVHVFVSNSLVVPSAEPQKLSLGCYVTIPGIDRGIIRLQTVSSSSLALVEAFAIRFSLMSVIVSLPEM